MGGANLRIALAEPSAKPLCKIPRKAAPLRADREKGKLCGPMDAATQTASRPFRFALRGHGGAPPLWRRRLRKAADLFPATLRGVLLAALSSLAWWRWGYEERDLLVFVFGAAGLALCFVSGLLVTVAAWRLGRYEKTAAAPAPMRRLEAGSPIETGFRRPAFERWPLVQLRWEWITPAGAFCRQRYRAPFLEEEVIARRRCEATSLVRRFYVESAFGLARISWQRSEPAAFLILPEVGRLRSLPPIHSFASGDAVSHPSGAPQGDRMEIRRYAPGDPVRHILWKVYARTRQLNVRVPERAVDRSRRTISYLLAGPEDEAAAAVARVALEQNLLGERWLFAADASPEPTEELEPALRAIARSGNLAQPTKLEGLHRFLRRSELAAEKHCVVFAPAPAELAAAEWLGELLALQASAGKSFTLVFGSDGVLPEKPAPLWQRILYTLKRDPALTTSAELQKLLAHCEQARCRAMVVERQSGRVFSAGPGRAG